MLFWTQTTLQASTRYQTALRSRKSKMNQDMTYMLITVHTGTITVQVHDIVPYSNGE